MYVSSNAMLCLSRKIAQPRGTDATAASEMSHPMLAGGHRKNKRQKVIRDM